MNAYIRQSAVLKLLQLIITICLELQLRVGGRDPEELPSSDAELEEGRKPEHKQNEP